MNARASTGNSTSSHFGDIFFEAQAVLMATIDHHINEFMIPQLIAINFPTKNVTAKKVTRGFASLDIDLAKQLLQLIGQNDPGKLSMIDLRAMMGQYKVPLVDAVEEARLAAMQAANDAAANIEVGNGKGGFPEIDGSQAASDPGPQITKDVVGTNAPPAPVATNETPPGGSPVPNKANRGTAGTKPKKPGTGSVGGVKATEHIPGVTDEQGRYVQQREVITLRLSDEQEFAQKLQKLYPFMQDEDYLTLTQEMRGLWRDAFKEAYGAIADELANTNLADEVVEPDDAMLLGPVDVSAALLKKISATALKVYVKYSAKTVKYLIKVLMRSGGDAATSVGKELGEFPSAQAYAENRVKGLADLLARTTEDEMRTFLQSELAHNTSPAVVSDAVRRHFESFPNWKADRVARHEATVGFNMGQLLAGQELGLQSAMAIDASHGTDHETDDTCIDRNGTVYSLEDAMQEVEAEHVNGTLHFRLIPPEADAVAASENGFKRFWKNLAGL